MQAAPDLFQLTNPDIPKPDDIAVVLEHDLPLPPRGEPRRIGLVLARRKRRVEARSAKVELHDLLAIEPVLPMVPAEDDR